MINPLLSKLRESIKRITAQKIVGIVLLAPPIFSVYLIFVDLMDLEPVSLFGISKAGSIVLWIGAQGVTSALPIYFGLMAIAGAILFQKK